MYAIGHFALGYIAGKGSSRLLKTKISVPLLMAVSVIPDIDLLLEIVNPALFMHRGLTHSVITYTVLMIPFFVLYRRQAIPYYVVLLSHSLIGDFFTGGIEAFWPLSQDWFGNKLMAIGRPLDVAAELTLFVVATSIMFKAGDLRALLRPKVRNSVLLIAFGAVLGPMLSVGEIESNFPGLLVGPSLFWIALFGYSIFLGLQSKPPKPSPTRISPLSEKQN